MSIFLMALVGCGSNESAITGLGFEADDKTFPGRPRRLVVEQDAAAPNEDIVLSGSENVHVGSFRMRSVGEAMLLTDFTLVNGGEDQTIDDVTVRYQDEGGVTTDSVGVLASGEVVFGGEDMFVPANRTGAILEVYATLNTSSDADPGMELRLDWVDDRVEAIGLTSGRTYREANTTDLVEGVEFEWHVSEPIVSLSYSSPSGASVPGLIEVLRFNIEANAGGDIEIPAFMFDFTATDKAGSAWNACDGDVGDGSGSNGISQSDFSLYDLTDGMNNAVETDDTDWVLYESDGTECEDGDTVTSVVLDLDSWPVVLAGTTYVFQLNVDVTEASSSSNDEVQSDLTDLEWWDEGVPFNGTRVDSLPVTGDTITF